MNIDGGTIQPLRDEKADVFIPASSVPAQGSTHLPKIFKGVSLKSASQLALVGRKRQQRE